MRLAELAGKRVHLVGLTSLEIADVACFLGRRGLGALVAHDLATPDNLFEHFRAAHIGMPADERQAHWDALAALALPMRLGDDYLRDLDDAEIVIASQAWRLYDANAPLARLLERGATTLITPIEVYLALARERGIGTIGVTGSNGKSTTSNMVAHLLREAGIPTVLAGNYRYRGPILETLDGLRASAPPREPPSADPLGASAPPREPSPRLVLEVSNHHLLALRDPVDVAVVTNVTPNHLEEHASFEEYVAVKRTLVECQEVSGVAILNAGDPVSREFAAAAQGRVLWFGSDVADLPAADGGLDREGWLVLREGGDQGAAARHTRLLPAADLPLPGAHNVQNALAAALAARAAGADPAALGAALATFVGPPGRLEVVREVAGVTLVDDLESTTPESTLRGLEAFPVGRVHLVAGGDNKGLDYAPFVAAARSRQVRLYLLDGTASDAILAAARHEGCAVSVYETLESAVGEAWARACPGDVILLSPAAKGFYNRHIRGRTSFNRLAKRLRSAELGTALSDTGIDS